MAGGLGGIVSGGLSATSTAVNAAGGVASSVASGAANASFMADMNGMQTTANQNQLGMAQLANTKALSDGLGKIIKSNGDSVKGVAPQ